MDGYALENTLNLVKLTPVYITKTKECSRQLSAMPLKDLRANVKRQASMPTGEYIPSAVCIFNDNSSKQKYIISLLYDMKY